VRIPTWFILVLLVLTPTCFGQSPSRVAPPQTTSGTGFIGEPYSGRETTVTVHTLADGSTTTQTFVQLVWRDSQGRTRREILRHNPEGGEYRSIIVTDPVAGMYVKWTTGYEPDPRQVTLWTLSRALTAQAPIPSSAPSSGKAEATSTPGFQREALPPQNINGVYAEGTRTTRTIALDEESSHRVIQVTNELWQSPELKIIVRQVIADPRTGTTTTELTDVLREDPNPELFKAPAGYAVVDHRAQLRR